MYFPHDILERRRGPCVVAGFSVEKAEHAAPFAKSLIAGGIPYLRSMAAPYKHLGIQYFPLGGLNAGNMLDYLHESNVPTIGGSWIGKKQLVDKEDWAGITARAIDVVKKLNG